MLPDLEELKRDKYKRQTVKRATCPKRKAYMKRYKKNHRARMLAYGIAWRARKRKEFYKANKELIDEKREIKKQRKVEREKERAQRAKNKALRILQRPLKLEERKRKAAEKSKALKNCPKRIAYLKRYRAANKLRRRSYFKEYDKKRRARDIEYKLQRTLRQRTRTALKRFNVDKTFQKPLVFLGCSVAELRQHIEKQFEPWMTWENHGQYGWHIDHIKPLAAFELSDPKQFAAASHYTNLQPMHWKKNLSKHAKII